MISAEAGSHRRETYRHVDLHRELMEAGREMAREGRPQAVVLPEATRREGIAPSAAYYRHFANRRALLDAAFLAAQAALAVAMEEKLAELVSEGNPAELARTRRWPAC